ncbi:MAG: hypothetical protein E7604_06600 [Ruminococcaceae bacterium]|nr:hypothetical protein [Oscillospiraceae bacterium]
MKLNIITAFLLLCAALTACGEAAQTPADTSAVTAAPDITETTAQETEFLYKDDLGDMTFGGAEFRIRTIQNANVHSYVDVAEESGDVYDDSLYKRNRIIEERFDIDIIETIAEDKSAPVRTLIQAGDDAFDLGVLRCDDAMYFYTDGLTYSISDIPNIDLSKPYWAGKLNESLTIDGKQYVAIGDYDINVLDLTYALAFNKQLVTDFDMESPYQLVGDGKWTMDAMLSMMTEVLSDINGDGVMDINDRWGFLSHSKQVSPNFWIGAGEMSILKDENDIPYINMTSERFVNVFDKFYTITWDAETWFSKTSGDYDVPTDNIQIFSEGRSMFMDVSFFHINNLRDMETDFGILPYPKYDEAQSEYYSRVSYYWANIIPVTNTKLEMTGAILEALNCESANYVVPAYYDIALKTKYSRDEESAAMLDLIFENRVVDLGDTVLCATIRDGFIAQMFKSNNRDIASQVAKKEKTIQKWLAKMPIDD